MSSYFAVLRNRRMVKVQTKATTTRAMSVSVPLPDATTTTAAATVTARRMYANQRGIRCRSVSLND